LRSRPYLRWYVQVRESELLTCLQARGPLCQCLPQLIKLLLEIRILKITDDILHG